jgi:hypothetical protein
LRSLLSTENQFISFGAAKGFAFAAPIFRSATCRKTLEQLKRLIPDWREEVLAELSPNLGDGRGQAAAV